MPAPTPKRGAVASTAQALAAAQRFAAPLAPLPLHVIRQPAQISFWGNLEYADCVTAEEAFAKACHDPEVFIPESDVITWASNHGVLNGASFTDVLQFMQADGFPQGPVTFDDGAYSLVDYANATTLAAAIASGAVKIAVHGDQLLATWQAAQGRSGWFATGFHAEADVDHAASLCGYGTLQWLAQKLHVQVPVGVDGSKPGYALFTWNSIGIIDQPSLLAITHEAWLRQPTTVKRTHDGSLLSLWRLNAQGDQASYRVSGPFAGWKPLNCSNNNVLWRNADGRISFWAVDEQCNRVSYIEHGPFPGWTALTYADGWILWTHQDGRSSLWKVDAQGNKLLEHVIASQPGWRPINCADNRLLWRNDDGRISLWMIDAQGNQVGAKEQGPFPGWTVVNYADGRLLWSQADGGISLWSVDGQGNRTGYTESGPFPGWTVVNCANDNVLWRNADGRISLWVVDPQGRQLSYKEHGPYPGWAVVNYADNLLAWAE